MKQPIKVMVVDDSATVRRVVADVLSEYSDVDVIATASDPLFAMPKMEANWPDVLVLDLEMPRMDGLTFLKKIMNERPTPVVICSTLTEKGMDITMQALAAGAVDIITKPKLGLKDFLQDEKLRFVQAIRAAAQARVGKRRGVAKRATVAPGDKRSADAILTKRTAVGVERTTDRVVAIGTSTGGTQALEAILTALPVTVPGIVIVQHMPEKFTKAFADRLDGLCEVNVREACGGDSVIPGRVLIAPGGLHLVLKRSGARYYVDVVDGPVVNRHKPSVDVLFRSAAKYAGPNALGIILTGMGDDGAAGLTEMKEAGAFTVAQDEASCVVYGMPREAVNRGGVQKILGLDDMAQEIVNFGATTMAVGQ